MLALDIVVNHVLVCRVVSVVLLGLPGVFVFRIAVRVVRDGLRLLCFAARVRVRRTCAGSGSAFAGGGEAGPSAGAGAARPGSSWKGSAGAGSAGRCNTGGTRGRGGGAAGDIARCSSGRSTVHLPRVFAVVREHELHAGRLEVVAA